MELARLLILSLLFLAAAPAEASEVIRNFVSDITIRADGTMTVEETITVRAEGKKIRRGIYRDFPIRYPGRFGTETVVAFQVIDVHRDGESEPWHTEALSNGVRVYMGSKNRHVTPGEHTYRLRYRTDRQLGYFEDHDELYWNVTGNGWTFPIERAGARVTLPRGATVQELVAYTGFTGQKLQDYEASGAGSGEARFVTTKPLPVKAGLTIVVAWPKGFVHPPAFLHRFPWVLRDFRGATEAVIGLVVVGLFFLLVWVWVGRDPAGGVTPPLFDPPPGISPAAARYLIRMGFDYRVFASALVSLAVKGRITIDGSKASGHSLVRQKGGTEQKLSLGEQAVLDHLFADRSDRVVLSDSGCDRVTAARNALEEALQEEYLESHFRINRGLWGVGLVLSVVAVVLAGWPVAGDPVLFVSVSVGLAVLGYRLYLAWRRQLWDQILLLGVLALIGLGLQVWAGSWAPTVLLLALAGLNVLFVELLKSPTRAGRKVLDRIEGFRLYLSIAEGDLLKTLGGPKRTPELYDRYLPYAMAFGVEQQWAERFVEQLTAARRGSQTYRPDWYSGGGDLFRPDDVHRLARRLERNVSETLYPRPSEERTSPRSPGSYSGLGGGGHSGGGGGGGGGGGW